MDKEVDFAAGGIAECVTPAKGNEGTTSTSPHEETVPKTEIDTVCSYYMKTGLCKFGATCKWVHPSDRLAVDRTRVRESAEVQASKRSQQKVQTWMFPHRPNAGPCAHFLRTKECSFGPKCVFDHPYGMFLPQREGVSQCAAFLQSKIVFGLVFSLMVYVSVGDSG